MFKCVLITYIYMYICIRYSYYLFVDICTILNPNWMYTRKDKSHGHCNSTPIYRSGVRNFMNIYIYIYRYERIEDTHMSYRFPVVLIDFSLFPGKYLHTLHRAWPSVSLSSITNQTDTRSPEKDLQKEK